jgi:hypothetical protein
LKLILQDLDTVTFGVRMRDSAMHLSNDCLVKRRSKSLSDKERQEFAVRGRRLNTLLEQLTMKTGGPSKSPFKVRQSVAGISGSTISLFRMVQFLGTAALSRISSNANFDTKPEGVSYQFQFSHVLCRRRLPYPMQPLGRATPPVSHVPFGEWKWETATLFSQEAVWSSTGRLAVPKMQNPCLHNPWERYWYVICTARQLE